MLLGNKAVHYSVVSMLGFYNYTHCSDKVAIVLVFNMTFLTVYSPTLSLSASGTCLVSLGFGNGDPVFILNSGGTFVSSTTWMGTDSAGYN